MVYTDLLCYPKIEHSSWYDLIGYFWDMECFKFFFALCVNGNSIPKAKIIAYKTTPYHLYVRIVLLYTFLALHIPLTSLF